MADSLNSHIFRETFPINGRTLYLVKVIEMLKNLVP